MTEPRYDVVVIGGGPGGYLAAIRAAQLGMSVACVDERERLGGTCLNVGCIPSKALLHSTEKFREARAGLSRYGVDLDGVTLNLDAMMAQKDRAVRSLTGGITQLFRKHRVEHVRGRGRLAGPRRVDVEHAGEARQLSARRVILATGSAPVPLPGIEADERRILTSTGALALGEVPDHLVVIGGGYIGLEMGSVWGRLGARVTCVERLERVLPGMDGELGKQMHKVLEEQGFAFRLGTEVSEARVTEEGVTLTIQSVRGEQREKLKCTHVLVAVGRRPYTTELGLDEVGVETDEKGFIRVDARFRTTVEDIYAIGDVVREPMLAHKAEDEALACVDGLAGRTGHVNYDAIPAIVYTWPEVASVGRTEDALRAAGVAYRVGRFPYRANSRARCTEETVGFVKILADAETDLVLGAHILGPGAGTTIHELVTTMEFGASAEELGRTSHGHPTMNEAVREAALAVHGRALHI